MKKTRFALFQSAIALMLCFSMLVGTTFAWFTDTVTSNNNVITAGNLDVELKYSTDFVNWNPVGANTNIFDETLWEPGHTEVVYLEISNAGNLALKYRLGVNIVSETGSRNQAGESFLLSDYIEFGAIKDVTAAYATRQAARTAVTSAQKISAGFQTTGSLLDNGNTQYVALVVYMPEDVKNEANYATGETPPQIKLGLNLYATQEMDEQDSFGSTYDAGATLPLEDLHFSVGLSVASKIDTTDNTLTEEVTLGSEEGEIYAEVPAGVKLADGATALTLSVNTMEESQANVSLEAGEVARSIDVHVEGLDNTNNNVPLTITLKGLFAPGLNQGNYAMYHVENGVTVPMNLKATAAEVVAHNDYYYDVATGDVVMCAATFSEYVTVEDDYNNWEGGFDYSWYVGESSPYTIYSADQLAGFGKIVDGTAENIEADDFAGEIVQLGANIDMNKGVSFNPIGFGYDRASYNTNGAEGKVFRGTFDGQGHTISNLYVNGWDIGISYSNSGGGLFASVCDATIKNLTMSNANIIMECVEQGVIAGLAQGTCTFDNININGCSVANYQRATGGVVGEVSPQYDANGNVVDFKHTFVDIDIDSTTVIGSLWGDFDAPVGGVIGAKWGNDTDAEADVIMENVNVACRLDVYNDVTSTYQWYAYRRAGMLIGNTEEVGEDGHTATASFLDCKKDVNGDPTVIVEYGSWIDYHYCEFNKSNSSWPWVRVEAGENCSAYSNPRWGVAKFDDGTPVTSADHAGAHNDGEGCMESIPFGQLYGGGQGVYGGGQDENYVATHEGVEIIKYDYKIDYVNNGVILHTEYVEDNSTKYDTPIKGSTVAELAEESMNNEYAFSHWINIGSKQIDSIPAGNTENVVLYPSFDKLYTAIFVDLDGNLLDWTTFTTGDYSKVTTKVNSVVAPAVEDCVFTPGTASWEVHVVTNNADGTVTTIKTPFEKFVFGSATSDVTLYPVYTFNGDVNLIPIDNNGDGITDEYQVGGYKKASGQAMVEIPNIFNGKKVTSINAEAFSSYDGVHSVVIPTNVEYIGDNAFAEGDSFGTGEMVTIYYEGTKDQWNSLNKTNGWDFGIGTGSRVFFLKDGKVDATQGYLEVVGEGGLFGIGTTYSWKEKTDFGAVKDVYTGACNCEISTEGDTGHIYKDANGNLMKHNDAGTPVGNNGAQITRKRASSYPWNYELTDGDETYSRYRLDAKFWN